MKIRVIVIISLMSLLMSAACYADSIWQKTFASPYTTEKGFRVGDVLTVLIMETTSAKQRAGTDTNVSDNLAMSFQHTITRLNPYIGPNESVSGSGSNKYRGLGQTTRTSDVQAKVAVTVIEIEPNGNVKIAGNHYVKVNDETQEIKISGLVRPKDITLQNTIFSYQVANADITVQGTGVVGSSQQPGWLTRFMNWIF
ncbi:MAG: flagellar basal body L-ring protein FlgH [bacterium]